MKPRKSHLQEKLLPQIKDSIKILSGIDYASEKRLM